MKLVAFPVPLPATPPLLLLPAMGLAALLLIWYTQSTRLSCSTRPTETCSSKPWQLESHFTKKVLPDASTDKEGEKTETYHMFSEKRVLVQPQSTTVRRTRALRQLLLL